jgi:DNA-binding HxlR family transcriptional regulator
VRSYGQYCAIAKALDAVGDRWSLLIVRELLLAGPRRYTDLRNALPGIATNLLAERLRELGDAGIVCDYDAPPPVATTLYRLTERGRALEPVLLALGRWGTPLMVAGPAEGDSFRGHWLSFAVGEFLTDHEPDAPRAAIELRAGEETATIDVGAGSVELAPGPSDARDAWSAHRGYRSRGCPSARTARGGRPRAALPRTRARPADAVVA